MTRQPAPWPIAALVFAACGPGQPAAPPAPPAPPTPPAASSPSAVEPAEAPDPVIAGLNLDFESKTLAPWSLAEAPSATLDTEHAHSGNQSARLEVTNGKSVSLEAELPSERARGKRLRVSGYLETKAVDDGWAALWARVDGPEGTLVLDNMRNRRITGTHGWQRAQVEVEVPKEATKLVFGALLVGNGTAWVDSLTVEVLEPEPPPQPTLVEGIVRGSDGQPVASAHVAFNVPNGDRAVARARSGPDGRFKAEVPSGSYVLSATAPGHAAVFTPVSQIAAGQEREPTTITLGSGGFTVTGQARDSDGKPAAGVVLMVYRFSDDVGDVFYTETDAKGHYRITLADIARGHLVLLDDPSFFLERPGSIQDDKDQTVDLVIHRRAPAPDQAVQWIAQNAIPLRTAEAGNGFADMVPIRQIVGRASVVALGEATHGTREFFQLKHRMLEFLVEKMGFTVFAIEANFTESLAINDYVLHGKGNAADALAGIYFWTWNTEEVLELIEWMRRYNADPSHLEKLEFHGFDMQFARVAIEKAAEYIAPLAPERAKTLVAVTEPLSSQTAHSSYSKRSDEDKRAIRAALAEAIAYLDKNRRRYIAKSNRNDFAYARQNLVVAQQAEKMMADPSQAFNIRDRAMADNVKWILGHKPRGTKVVAWAHNGHVQRSRLSLFNTMGTHLANELGKRYLAVGFAFNRGSYQAIYRPPAGKGGGGLQKITVGPAPAGNIGATMDRAGIPLFALDLRKRPRTRRGKPAHPATAWLETPHLMRNPGALHSTDEGTMSPQILAELFDAMLFVAETTRARPVQKSP